MALTDRQIKALKPQMTAYKATDSGGLYLLVHPNGSKYWRWKYRITEQGKRKEKVAALGVYPEVSLGEARSKRDEWKQKLSLGIDPNQEKKIAKQNNQDKQHSHFAVFANAWYQIHQTKVGAKTQSNIQTRLEKYIIPYFGNQPIETIKRPNIAGFIDYLNEKNIPAEAEKILQTTGQIFGYALTKGLIEYNPTDSMAALLKSHETTHHPALPQKEVVPFFKAYLQGGGEPVTRYALLLIMLTAARNTAFRLSKWEHIDFTEKTWFMPNVNMKQGNNFLIPLADWSIELLRELHTLTGHQEYLFPRCKKGGGKKPTISENTINKLIYSLGYDGNHENKSKAVQHGFRSLFTDVCMENQYSREVAKKALGHTEKDKTFRAYFRTDMLEERRRVAIFYANWLKERYIQAQQEIALEQIQQAQAILDSPPS